MSQRILILLLLLCTLVFASACGEQEKPLPPVAPVAPASPATADEPPPAPPLKEDFEGEPKLSLFPRAGDFSPEEGDLEGRSLWLTYIDHLVRTSGPVKGKKGNAFALRSLKTVDSVGFFSPLAVTPDTSYRVSFRFWSALPADGQVGAGVLEFDEFLWIPGQYPRSLSEKHFQRAQPGVQLTGSHEGTTQTFTFRTGAKTRMIHLVFYREGAPAKEPVVIDDIEIRQE